jgi:signal transduction histidine kinase
MLLKIFAPIAMVLLPILLPINRYSGDSTGLDKLSISNISAEYRKTRLWAHLVLALGTIGWICYVLYSELRGYIRVRQAFLTSPQHRLRASATTVLVTGIPRKWLTVEALNGLYDVFPGGIRNIWINRNFDDLSDKVQYRASLNKSLEDAETNLVKMCSKKKGKADERKRKEEGRRKKTKKEEQEEQKAEDAVAESMAQGGGMSAGDQHSTPHGLQEALHEAEEAEEKREEHEHHQHKPSNSLGIIGEGFGTIGQGLANIGKGVGALGRNIVGDVDNGFHRAAEGVDHRVDNVANLGSGFVEDVELYRRSQYSQGSVPPTPPPKSPVPRRQPTVGAQVDGSTNTAQGQSPATGSQQHPLATIAPVPGDAPAASPASYGTQIPPSIRMTGPSLESKPRSGLQIEVPADHTAPRKKWQFWKNNDKAIALPSPQPHAAEEDEFPLNRRRSPPDMPNNVSGSKFAEKVMFWKKKKQGDDDEDVKEVYPDAYVQDWDEDQDGEPVWRRYLEPKERETMRVPIFSPSWCPSLPLVGKKVDRIYYLRRELARMNLQIETDQNDVEKFPFMNSAFIQFNHQVAAHMACQSVSHHVPQHMAPRLVEISPDDVLWDNMSIKWWERYLRTGLVLAIAAGLIIFYAIPVTFTSLLAKISTLSDLRAFNFLNSIPPFVINIIQGPLPPIILAVILSLVPIIFRVLVKQQGVATGNGRELGVQKWYFAFLFIQVFLIVTISGGLINLISSLASDPNGVLNTLGRSLPRASNYFFSYLTVQALSNSASALLQVGALLSWFILAPILDSTARAKWRRQTTLPNVQWGSFFPPFTNFAVIGIIYSILAPLILVFMIVIFGLFWIVYRYNVLYVYQFRNDTGGLLFPTAVNQLFTGLYVMELCLIGFFFISVDPQGDLATYPQAIIMIVALLSTITFQFLLNDAFKPLFQYLPITLEDEAVIRDEEFARAQASKFAPLRQNENPDDERDIQDVLEEREQKEEDAEDTAEERERRDIAERRRSHRDSSRHSTMLTAHTDNTQRQSWHNSHAGSEKQSWKTDRWRHATPQAVSRVRHLTKPEQENKPTADGAKVDPQTAKSQDIEAQRTIGDVLFSGFADEIEDLTPDERDLLVRYAFQHSALRAKRPVVWIPRDKLGVSDDEIKRAKRMSTVFVDDHENGGTVEKTNIWISNEGVALNGRGKVVFRRSPPDFSNVDLIAL